MEFTCIVGITDITGHDATGQRHLTQTSRSGAGWRGCLSYELFFLAFFINLSSFSSCCRSFLSCSVLRYNDAAQASQRRWTDRLVGSLRVCFVHHVSMRSRISIEYRKVGTGYGRPEHLGEAFDQALLDPSYSRRNGPARRQTRRERFCQACLDQSFSQRNGPVRQIRRERFDQARLDPSCSRRKGLPR